MAGFGVGKVAGTIYVVVRHAGDFVRWLPGWDCATLYRILASSDGLSVGGLTCLMSYD